MTQQWKFVKASYFVESVFIVPVEWEDKDIYVKWNTLHYKDSTVEPVLDCKDAEHKYPADDIEITADGDCYNSKEFEEWLEENYQDSPESEEESEESEEEEVEKEVEKPKILSSEEFDKKFPNTDLKFLLKGLKMPSVTEMKELLKTK
jgi:hypothetical protein